MKPCHLELRLRVAAAYEEGQGAIFEIAALFRRKIAEWDAHQFVFVYEMGSNLSLTRLYGRAELGVRVVDAAPGAGGENCSTIGALALDWLRAAMSVGGSIDGDVMSLFVKQSLCPRLRPEDILSFLFIVVIKSHPPEIRYRFDKF